METCQIDSSGCFYATLIDSEKNTSVFVWRNNLLDAKMTQRVSKPPEISQPSQSLTIPWGALMGKGMNQKGNGLSH
jgi:hypothetical protein